jgi:hypothetical protein
VWRKKNGCCGPSRNRARIRQPDASHYCRSAQNRRIRRRGRGVSISNCPPLRWCSGFDRTPPPAGTRSDQCALRVWRPISV